MAIPSIKLAVIGASGAGKSTFLNALLGTKRGEDKFKVAATSVSCTQEVGEQTFTMQAPNAPDLHMTLVDTMGFPDPDPKKAIEYYNQVVAACNQPLNAILWLVRGDRVVPVIYSQYRTLMNEFKRCNCPIIMIVNGWNNYIEDNEYFGNDPHPDCPEKTYKEFDLDQAYLAGKKSKS